MCQLIPPTYSTLPAYYYCLINLPAVGIIFVLLKKLINTFLIAQLNLSNDQSPEKQNYSTDGKDGVTWKDVFFFTGRAHNGNESTRQ